MPFVCLEARRVERSSELIAEILRNFGMRRKKQHAGIKMKRSNCLHRWCGKHHDSRLLITCCFSWATCKELHQEVALNLRFTWSCSEAWPQAPALHTHPRALHTIPVPYTLSPTPPCPTHHPHAPHTIQLLLLERRLQRGPEERCQGSRVLRGLPAAGGQRRGQPSGWGHSTVAAPPAQQLCVFLACRGFKLSKKLSKK